jgi:hypothetical protein
MIQNLEYADAMNHGGKIVLAGFFQQYRLYELHTERLKYMFNYDDSIYERPNENDLVVHIRLGDCVGLHNALDISIYVDIIKSINYDKCIILTDSPDSPLLREIRLMRETYIRSKSVLEDFSFMKNAKTLIISQSTFSWWASFFGNQTRVYVPLDSRKNDRYAWKLNPENDGIDLIPKNEKYIKVEI